MEASGMLGNGASALELLVFDVGGRTFGVASNDVVELVRAVAVAPLPTGPRVVTGVINLRGHLIPVFDLRMRFGMESALVEPSEHFIVARAGRRTVAVRADRARKLSTIAPETVIGAEDIVKGTRHIAGVANVEGEVVLIHDLDAFLSEAEQATLDRAMGTAMEVVT